MATVDYVHHLAFPKLSEAEVECLAGLATICSFEDGETIFQAGQRGLPFYVVESGEIAIVDESADEPKTIVVHGPREFTGDVSLLDRPPRRHLGLRQGRDPGLLRQPGRAAPGDPGDPRPQRQAARGVPDAPDHAGAVRLRRRARLRAPRRSGPDGHPRVLRQEQGAAHLDRRRRAGRPGRHEVAGGRPGSIAVRRLQPGHALAASHGHPAGRVPRPEAPDPHRAVRPGDRRGRAGRPRGGRLRRLRGAGHHRPRPVRPGRPGRDQLADRELHGIPRRPDRGGPGQPGLPPGPEVRGRAGRPGRGPLDDLRGQACTGSSSTTGRSSAAGRS